MNKKASFLLNNLSTLALFIVYISLVVIHLINDGFIMVNQLGLMITMLPFLLIGIALDYLLKNNPIIMRGLRIFAQLLPLGIFLMQMVTTVIFYLNVNSYDVFDYLIWVFLSLPFFITSYEKEGMRPRVIRTLYGTGAVAVVYIFLLTQTKELTYGIGELIYFISYFLILFIVSGNRKLPYIGTIIGILNAAALLLMRYFPITSNAKEYGWDHDIAFFMELLVLTTLVLCIIIRILEEVFHKKKSEA